MNCPKCESEQIIKNGSIHNGKQKYLCKDCGRQFVENPQHRVISDETKSLIDKLLLEKLSLAGIARVTDVSERWLQIYVNELYQEVPRQAEIRGQKNND